MNVPRVPIGPKDDVFRVLVNLHRFECVTDIFSVTLTRWKKFSNPFWTGTDHLLLSVALSYGVCWLTLVSASTIFGTTKSLTIKLTIRT